MMDDNYSRKEGELICRSCGKVYISKEYFRKVKEAAGLPPNCTCQLGSGDIGGRWIENTQTNTKDIEPNESYKGKNGA